MSLNATTAPIELLTAGQKACLRLVMQHFSSKEIARELGISPHTVDMRIKRANAALGLCTRFESARALASCEQPSEMLAGDCHAYQPLVYQRPDVSETETSPTQGWPTGRRNPPDGKMRKTLNETLGSFVSQASEHGKSRFFGLGSGKVEQSNDLGLQARALAMLAIVIGCVLVFSIFVSVLEGLSRLY
jgi:DNA-binding CsgD family transcriptional regulator